MRGPGRWHNSTKWFVLLLLSICGCSGGSEDVRPWKPEDHDNSKAARTVQTSGITKPGDELATLITITWDQNCTSCHGRGGRGDGPQGRMVRAPDLGRPDWQDRVTDESIANVIRKGRNKMPSYSSLPDKVVDGLVVRVRSFKR